MSINGQQNINIGLPNESIGSDSLYTAFTKTQDNFNTLFTCASPYTNFVGGNGIITESDANSATVTIINTGVTSIIAGTNITVSHSNGEVTISSTGGNGNGGGGTVTSVGITPVSDARLVVTNSPIISDGNIGIDLATTGVVPGTYTAPTLTLDAYGRITGAANSISSGTVTSVGIIPGSGIGVASSPVTTVGNITVTNTGVVRLTAGSGISLSAPNGIVQISSAFSGTVTSVGVTSNTLLVTSSPIISNGNINVELPSSISLGGNLSASLLTGTLTTAAQPNITSVGTLTSLTVTGKATAGQLQGEGGNISNIQGANVTGQVGYAAIANSIAAANISGTVNLANYATVANSVAGANVSGAVAHATVANSVAGANVSGAVAYATTANSVAGANVTGAVAYATTANSVAAANISGTVNLANYASVANSVAGANVSGAVAYATTANAVAGANVSGIVANANYAAYAGNAATVTGSTQNNITTLGAITTISTGANTTAGTITGNWGLSAGSQLTATYADLAEYYQADAQYEPGTVVEFGGEYEITLASEFTTRVAGVVSTNPAFAMNETCPDIALAIALQGRVPCKVQGTIRKGDMMISAGAGYAVACSEPKLGQVIGKALENFDESAGVIEIVVGRM